MALEPHYYNIYDKVVVLKKLPTKGYAGSR
jgi:hypothetical protein